MNNSLAKQYSMGSLFRFALPNMVMMLCLSLYTVVDGAFVARLIGTTALSAVNMVYPVINVQLAIAIMLATGGNAIIAKRLGEQKVDRARALFSFLVAVELLAGIVFAVAGLLFIDPLLGMLGATEAQYELSRTYLGILFIFAPFFFLQTAFQTFFVTAGVPSLGLAVTIAGGLTNVFLDYLFMKPLAMGVAGAALATGIGYILVAVIGILYFAAFRDKPLYFVKPSSEKGFLFHTCTNGSSEMVTNFANAVTTFLFNYTFLTFYGEDGVAAITIALYFEFLFTAVYFGYANGIAPIASYKYGEENHRELKSSFRSSVIIIAVASVIGFMVSQAGISEILTIFTPKESHVYQIVRQGFWQYAFAFLFMGFNIFASAWFTALSNGRVSAVISFSRTFVFLVGAILLLPIPFKEMGAWLAIPSAECLGILISIYYVIKYKKVYHY